MPITAPARRHLPGMIFSLIALAASLLYCAAEIAHVVGWLDQPYYDIIVFGSSILIATPFAIAMTALYHAAPAEDRFWVHAALVLAAMYAVLVSLVYFVQLTIVLPARLSGAEDAVRLLLYKDHSFLASVDGLGYVLMALSLLVASPAFSARGFERWMRVFFAANGLLAPIVVLVLYRHEYLLWGTIWMVTEPGALLLMTLYFAQRPASRPQPAAVRGQPQPACGQ